MKLDKVYQPASFEAEIYAGWEASGGFAPRGGTDRFVTVLPPPNANADLHIGHALDLGLKDVIGRWQRLKGRSVLLLPGADHAGFETWDVYERHLNQSGQSRFDFSRQQLYDQVAAFVNTNRDRMTTQVRRLGISCDWSRFRFSLDDQIVASAESAFEKMWRDGLIYRGHRLVNYCLKHGTGFADREVAYHDQALELWDIRYSLESDPEKTINVSTSRPETLLADVAVAVHPDDERYRDLIGETVIVPIVDRSVPVIADDAVVADFGSGALKVTPGCDFFDADLAEKHQLPVLDLIDKSGQLVATWIPEPYKGLDRDQARERVLEQLQAIGRLGDKTSHQTRVGRCYKCESILEPIRQKQWFVNMKPLAKIAITALEQKRIKFYPDSKRQELIDYLKQLKDWNISRQIAWGIPIPVAVNEADDDDWIFIGDRTGETEIEKDGHIYRPDPDVFDTWWSSSQWPWASLGWPADNANLYPTDLMETGIDILRAWVSRMICLGLFLTDEVPFKNVYLHGMVVDSQGAKMSKSKGNVINPITVVDQAGADALRLGLIQGISPGQSQSFGPDQIKAGRNFCNKLWNIGRFIASQETAAAESAKSDADSWIWQRLQNAEKAVDDHLEAYRFNEALGCLYQFVWHDLADWYIEANKAQPNPANLKSVFEQTLKLAHPWIPFVTEALWRHLIDRSNWLMNQSPITIAPYEAARANRFQQAKATIEAIRSLRGHLRPSGWKLILDQSGPLAGAVETVKHLSLVTDTHVGPRPDSGGWLNLGRPPVAWLKLSRDDHNQIKEKQANQITALKATIEKLQIRLKNDNYIAKAPQNIIKQTQDQLKNCQKELTGRQEIIAVLSDELGPNS